MTMPDYTEAQKAAAFDALWKSCGSGMGELRTYVNRPVTRSAREATFVRVPVYAFQILAEGDGMQRFRDVLHHLVVRAAPEVDPAKGRQEISSAGGVACPLEVIEQLAAINPVDEHDDNGPGRVTCPACGAWMWMQWSAGERKDDCAQMTHSDACAAEWAREALKTSSA